MNNSIASTNNTLLLVNQKLEEYLEGIEQLSLPQIQYDEIMNAIQNEADDYSSRMFLEDYLRNLFFSRVDMEAIYLYLVDEHKYYYISREAYNISIRVIEDPDIINQSWYKQLMTDKQNQLFQSFVIPDETEEIYQGNTDSTFMAYHRVLRSIASREPQAVISFSLNSSTMENIVKDIPFTQGEHLLLLDTNNRPFYLDDLGFYEVTQNEEFINTTANGEGERITWTVGGNRYLVVYNVGEQIGWKLIKPIPLRMLYEAATTTRNVSYFIGFLFLIVAIILVTWTANAITKPLKKLSRQMELFSSGTFDAVAQVRGQDEIAYLNRHFNDMVKRTNELINERYKMKLVEKNALLRALEAQINPHFLYNALQAISTKALKSDHLDIVEMVDALALTLRYCISGKDIVIATEELRHIENYLLIQKARFGDRIQVKFEWDEDLRNLQIPKLSVQSLVENSVKHAVEKVSNQILIIIQANVTSTHTVISVKDNGPGMSVERLQEVLRSFSADGEDWGEENIGLKNLYSRLKLLYGEEADLEIRTDSLGTEMHMLIPLGGNNNV
ncbi:cache domain-containing sensor histidine kinase [Paenibacillus crassostreae]|uniref:cache domain-containing sensor histidine kinase n=1 Tax=Paenibacillus crassostreae TaxID=1763538 RepID=UPI002FCC6416